MGGSGVHTMQNDRSLSNDGMVACTDIDEFTTEGKSVRYVLLVVIETGGVLSTQRHCRGETLTVATEHKKLKQHIRHLICDHTTRYETG
jgi:hypothetical protein